MDREKAKKKLAEICHAIGCSGMSSTCPGDYRCEIIRKVIGQMEIKRRRDN